MLADVSEAMKKHGEGIGLKRHGSWMLCGSHDPAVIDSAGYLMKDRKSSSMGPISCSHY